MLVSTAVWIYAQGIYATMDSQEFGLKKATAANKMEPTNVTFSWWLLSVSS